MSDPLKRRNAREESIAELMRSPTMNYGSAAGGTAIVPPVRLRLVFEDLALDSGSGYCVAAYQGASVSAERTEST